MAIKQNKSVRVADILGSEVPGEVQLDVLTRLRELKFPHPSDSNVVFVFEAFAGGKAGVGSPHDTTIHLIDQRQEPVPEVDELDPVTGEVVVPAGAYRPAIPSVEEIRAMPLPEGAKTVETFGDLFDVARRQIYLAAIQLIPDLQGGEAV